MAGSVRGPCKGTSLPSSARVRRATCPSNVLPYLVTRIGPGLPASLSSQPKQSLLTGREVRDTQRSRPACVARYPPRAGTPSWFSVRRAEPGGLPRLIQFLHGGQQRAGAMMLPVVHAGHQGAENVREPKKGGKAAAVIRTVHDKHVAIAALALGVAGFAELLSPEQPSHETVRLWLGSEEEEMLCA